MFKGVKFQHFFSFQSAMSAFFYSLIIITLFVKYKNSTVLSTFDKRIISQATIDGVDIAARNSTYFQVLLVGILSFILFSFLFSLVKKWIVKNPSSEHPFIFEETFIHILSLFGIVNVVFGLLGSAQKVTIAFILMFQILILIVTFLKMVAIRNSWTAVNSVLSERYYIIWLFLMSFVVSVYTLYFGKGFLPIVDGITPLLLQMVVYVACFLIFLFLTLILCVNLLETGLPENKNTLKTLISGSFPLVISPIFLPVSNELYLIFNQHEIFLSSPRVILWPLLGSSLIAVIILVSFLRGKNNLGYSIIEKGYFPISLINFIMIAYQPVKEIGPPIELFESGNPGIAVDQLFRYGKIPLLETFNAHALSELVSPILYAVLNGYDDNAIFIYYTVFNYVLYIIIAYFLLRKLISSELAFLTLLLIPFSMLTSYILPEYYLFAAIAVFALHKIMKKSNFKTFLLFFFILSLTFVWRFDLGAGAIPAAVISLVLYNFLYKKKWYFKEIILSGLCVGVFWGGGFILLALIKGIPVMFRIKELLAVVSSNQVWGFSTLGDMGKVNYSLFYFILPTAIVLILGYILVKKLKSETNPVVFTTLIFLILFSLFNFPRGLVRHSLVEQTPLFLLGLIAIPIIYLPYLIWERSTSFKRFSGFAFSTVAYAFLVIGIMYGTRSGDDSLLSKTALKVSEFSDYENFGTKVDRYQLSDEYINEVYAGFKYILDETTNTEETFLDFSNAPYMYIHTNRETPMYINQTPVFLSDEYTQDAYLKEIQSYSAPYAIFANELGFRNVDGVPNHIRSYRVAEYIYNHYVPFIKLNGFDVWVDKDRKEEMESKLMGKNEIVEYVLLDENQTSLEALSVHDLEKAEKSNFRISYETGSKDPQIANFFTAAGQSKIPLKDTSQQELEIEYSSKKGGEMQVFYLIGSAYNDVDSSTVSLEDGTRQTLKIDVPVNGMLYDLRIDPPSDDTFTIHSVKLKITNNIFKKLEYPIQEIVDIGWVPFLWGEKDTLEATVKAPKLVDVLSQKVTVDSSESIFPVNEVYEKVDGNYIHLRLKSNLVGDDYPATISYGSSLHDELGSFTFNIKADGNFHDYLIRPSSQYNWYQYEIDNITLTTNQETTLENLSILKGD